MDNADIDLMYRPPSDPESWWQQLRPERVLLLGDPEEGIVDLARSNGARVRVAGSEFWAGNLCRGTYAARVKSAWVVVVVLAGKPPSDPRDAEFRFTQNDLVYARKAIAAEWDDAKDLTPAPFSEGDFARVVGESNVGIVTTVRTSSSGIEVHLQLNGEVRQHSADSLEPVDGDPRDPKFWLRESPSSAADFALALTVTKLNNALSDVLYSYSSSKTVFRPYQFIPVLKLLRSSTGRLLIADEVGLGKTIEAGLIWSELDQRVSIRNALVVAPASLQEKWRSEMARRFDRELDRLKADDLHRFAADLRDGRDPDICGVISIESMRRAEETLDILEGQSPHFDLVIVDEAHVMRNSDTASFRLGKNLSDWSDYLIFLSATPLNLGTDDLFNLINLLDDNQYPSSDVFRDQLEPNRVLNEIVSQLPQAQHADPRPLRNSLGQIAGMPLGGPVAAHPDFQRLKGILGVGRPLAPSEVASAKKLAGDLNTLGALFTRTRKVDVPDAKAIREPVTVDVDWTATERRFYDVVEESFRELAKNSGNPPGFVMQMPLRQAASCLPAMRDYLRQRIQGVTDVEIDNWIAEAGSEVDVSADPNSDATAVDPLAEIDVAALMSRAQDAESVDSKFDALRERLLESRRKGMSQVMLFSFFRRTLAYLGRRLSADFSVRVMHGGTPIDERESIMQEFRRGDFEILLSSEVGSEGLDFEFCNVLVNYDLPWNPMKVEQRIGRLDRFGQQYDKVFVINMHVPGTIETDIFERLYDRIGVFHHSIGELEPILQGEFRDLSNRLLEPELSTDQRRQKADQLAVAMEKRQQDVAEVNDSRGVLSLADQLEIDGISNEGPLNGRYIGPLEMRGILESLLAEVGGKLAPLGTSGRYRLQMTNDLSQQLTRKFYRESRRDVKRVLRAASETGSMVVTFDSDTASRTDAELISSRHPLIQIAQELFSDSPNLHRLGAVRIPGVDPRRHLLARIDVATSSGITPRTELWVTAIDIHTREQDPDIERSLLTALAEGKINDAPGLERPAADIAEALDDLCSARRRREEDARRSENNALVDARIEAQQQTLDRQIAQVDAMLRQAQQRGHDERILRMQRGRRRNLDSKRHAAVEKLEAKRHLNLSVRQVSYALIEGVSGFDC